MMRTLNELEDSLSEDMAWRRTELQSLLSQVRTARGASVSIQPTPAVLFAIALRDRGRAGDAHAGIGGIQGLPAKALRIAAMTPVPCLRAVSR